MHITHDNTLNANHTDYALFMKIFNTPHLRGSSVGHGQDQNGDTHTSEGHYIKCPGIGTWDYDQDSDYLKDLIESRTRSFNDQALECHMTLGSFTDYEMAYDGDRAHSASFSLSFIHKCAPAIITDLKRLNENHPEFNNLNFHYSEGRGDGQKTLAICINDGSYKRIEPSNEHIRLINRSLREHHITMVPFGTSTENFKLNNI